VTHHFKDCTIDLRGAGYACVSRGDEFEIGHTGEGDRVLIEGDTLDFTGLLILGPVALADRIKAAVALECYALATERDALRAEIARLTAERDAALAGAVKVRPLVWVDFHDRGAKAHAWNEANYMIQKWSDGRWEISAGDPGYSTSIYGTDRFYPTIEAAKAAAQADYEARILAAIQPDPDARQADLAKAWMMGREDAVGAAKHAGLAFGYERAVQAIRALTPPADLAAKIGGEA